MTCWMAKTWLFKPQMSSPLPVNLITGLLGSGKTTTLKHLISQKPPTEIWAILINEFGDIGIDAASLPSDSQLTIHEVSGGCICCTAQFGLQQALQTLLTQPNISRLIIEPTGLGHPAKLLDTLKQPIFPRQLQLRSQICVINPQHLTPLRWQKSGVMRDLVSLADILVLNKMDVCSPADLAQAHDILDGCYPPKHQRLTTQFGKTDVAVLDQPHSPPAFLILSGTQQHAKAVENHTDKFVSQLPDVVHSQLQTGAETWAIGWVWSAKVQFNRTLLNAFFQRWQPFLLRGKGIIRTGLEWQLLNLADQQLQLSDVAWRQDSRLELIFDAHLMASNPLKIEQDLQNTLILKG